MATVNSSFVTLDDIESTYEQIYSGGISVTNAVTWAQAAWDNANYFDIASFSTLTSSVAAGTLTNGDTFVANGSNMNGYPQTISRLDYQFVSNGVSVKLYGSVTNANEIADPVGYINQVEVQYGQAMTQLYGYDNVALDGDTVVSSFAETVGATVLTGSGSIAANAYPGSSGYYEATLSGTIDALTLSSGSQSASLSGLSLDPNTDYATAAQFLTAILAGDDVLIGGPAGQTLAAYAGNDVLDGRADADHLIGGPGHDTYIVDHPADVVTELPGEGADNIQSWISFQLPDNVESLFLLAAGSLGIGNALDNYIQGAEGAEHLYGSLGNDTLVGLAGNDVMNGELGNDSIVAGDGNDSIFAGDGNDWVHGNAGDDTIRGSLGNDDLRGGQGNDVMYAGQGSDTLWGALGDDEMRGGLESDTLTGGQGNDTLSAGQGDDLLQGRAGNDLLYGKLGADTFWFNAAGASTADTIADFSPGEDAIELDSSLLASLAGMAGGSPAEGNFLAGVGPVSANTNQLLLYDTSTGDFYYDSDGSGATGAERIATLTGAPVLSESDIFVS